MLADKSYMIIDGKRVPALISYKLESDIFQASDAFEIEVPPLGFQVTKGQRVQLYVNDTLELNGFIEGYTDSASKAEKSFILRGKDLMGILLGTHLETFETLKDTTLRELAEYLFANTDMPFVDIKQVAFGRGTKNSIAEESKANSEVAQSFFADTKKDYVQIELGDTVFSVIQKYAAPRGLIFFSMPDGRFVFSRPEVSGKPKFFIRRDKNIAGKTNVISGTKTEDISQSYSKVTVKGQKQGTNILGVADVNVSGEAVNEGFPFEKPFFAPIENDVHDADRYARLLLEAQRFSAFQLEYKMIGHSQSGENYQVNSVGWVDDNEYNVPVAGAYLIYSRVFEMSKGEAPRTTLKLSQLGALPA